MMDKPVGDSKHAYAFGSSIAWVAMHHNNRTLGRRTPIRKYTRDKPAEQLHMIFPTRKANVSELQIEIGWRRVKRQALYLDQFRGAIADDNNIDGGYYCGNHEGY